jgi:hypothetical protein
MLLLYRLPLLLPGMHTARIETVHATPTCVMAPGQKLFDLRVDLSGSVAHDCPPVSYFRAVLRERVWLRRLAASPGAEAEPDTPLAWFTTTPDEAVEGDPARAARVAHAGILAPVSLVVGEHD